MYIISIESPTIISKTQKLINSYMIYIKATGLTDTLIIKLKAIDKTVCIF